MSEGRIWLSDPFGTPHILKSILKSEICNPQVESNCDKAERINYAPIVAKTIQALSTDSYKIGVFYKNGQIEKLLEFEELLSETLDDSKPIPNAFFITNTVANTIEGTLRLYNF